jgi:hypothetical protein
VIEQLRERWGYAGDPPADVLFELLSGSDPQIIRWVGHSYPPALHGLVSRVRSDGRPALGGGRGWWPLMSRLAERLARVDPDYTVVEVKAVGGKLRFEAETGTSSSATFEGLTWAARSEAVRTCERCARAGIRREYLGSRAVVLCHKHTRSLSDDEVACALQGGVPPTRGLCGAAPWTARCSA